MTIKTFTFNPFQENTYLVYASDKSAVIIDPGCATAYECAELVNFIEQNELTVKV